MSLLAEYINKGLSIPDLEGELLRLIARYNKLRKTYLFVYCAAIGKQIPGISLEQTDYYTICDMLNNRSVNKLDFYIETPGGSGETAEEIVRYLHNRFENVSFVVSGEAKSAGTLMVLSGDEILITETGSLGPIDAQMRIGRSIISAYDYLEWINDKREEAGKNGALNPFDATMVAQISPGELGAVYHSLKFAEDLVIEWLVKYKFKNWNTTRTRKAPVTMEMKEQTAQKIAQELTNHRKWRSHGRSIKIDDLERIGLEIIKIDQNRELSDTVHRIQTICRLIFDSTTIYKIFATQENKIFRMATPIGSPIAVPGKSQVADVAEVNIICNNCKESYKFYAKLVHNKQIDIDFRKKGIKSFPKSLKFKCKCGAELDLSGAKNQIEAQTGKKVILS